MGNSGPGVVALALRLLVGVLAALVLAVSVAERAWLGGRAWWIGGFAVATWAWAWWPRGRRHESAWAAACGLVTALVAAPGLRRLPPGSRFPGEDVHFTGIGERIVAADLPPQGVYAAVIASATAAVVAVALALPWRNRARAPRRAALAAGLAGGVLMGGIAVVAADRGAREARDVVDRRLEAEVVTATTTRDATHVDASGGPTVPTEIAWHHLPSRPDNEWVEGAVVAHGWDAVIVKSSLGDEERRHVASQIRALSISDGSVLWSYRRDDGAFDSVAVDPDRGRVLVLADRAALVLDLASGAEVAGRPLPTSLENGAPVRDFGHDLRPPGDVVLGSWIVVEGSTTGGGSTLGVVEVATGEVLATMPVPAVSCDYAASTTTAAPVVVQWASDGDCGGPHLLHLDSSQFRTTEIALDGWGSEADAEHCRLHCEGVRMAATDEVIVLSVWTEPYSGPGEIVAMSHAGEILWRASATVDDPHTMELGALVVAVTEEHVLAWWDDRWNLLSVTDGTEQARASHCGNAFAVAADGRQAYAACDDTTAVFRIEDLALLSDAEPSISFADVIDAGSGHLLAADLGSDGIVALGP